MKDATQQPVVHFLLPNNPGDTLGPGCELAVQLETHSEVQSCAMIAPSATRDKDSLVDNWR